MAQGEWWSPSPSQRGCSALAPRRLAGPSLSLWLGGCWDPAGPVLLWRVLRELHRRPSREHSSPEGDKDLWGCSWWWQDPAGLLRPALCRACSYRGSKGTVPSRTLGGSRHWCPVATGTGSETEALSRRGDEDGLSPTASSCLWQRLQLRPRTCLRLRGLVLIHSLCGCSAPTAGGMEEASATPSSAW